MMVSTHIIKLVKKYANCASIKKQQDFLKGKTEQKPISKENAEQLKAMENEGTEEKQVVYSC